MSNRLTINDLRDKVAAGEKLVTIAAYTAPMAALCDEVADIILVGDSLGMVIYGMESTIPVHTDLMINHGKAVVNSSQKAFIVVDMPFASYQESKEKAFRNAAKIIKKTGAAAVKLEGGSEMADTVKYLSERGIMVMGHIGLMPQFVNKMGGYKCQGQDKNSVKKLVEDAESLEKAGAFALVIEGVKQQISDKIVKKISIPVIGIGASKKCAGQVLVVDDILGLTKYSAKFVKQYANFHKDAKLALNKYAMEVREQVFPDSEHLY